MERKGELVKRILQFVLSPQKHDHGYLERVGEHACAVVDKNLDLCQWRGVKGMNKIM